MRCIAYLPNGNICRREAHYLDKKRGGMICRFCRDGYPPESQAQIEANMNSVTENECPELLAALNEISREANDPEDGYTEDDLRSCPDPWEVS